MSKTCWCYTTDEGYLLPTLVSATQLRRNIGSIKDDIVIAYFGDSSPLVEVAEYAALQSGFKIIIVPISFLRGFPMICARLFLADIVGEHHEFIVYLDGDTQICGDVIPLSQAAPRPGSLFAAPDLMALMTDDPGRQWKDFAKYFKTIGISRDRQTRYFNSGVIKVRRSDWDAISRECLSLLSKTDSNRFMFRDQDALNIVTNGSHELLSLRWNWPAFFLGRNIDKIVPPNIIHFMSKPRPWDGSFPPWGAKMSIPYREFVNQYPALSQLYKPMKKLRAIRYQAQQRFKQISENWGSPIILERISIAEKIAAV